MPRIPQTWVDQLAGPQGILLTELHLGIEGGLVRFQRQPDGELFGTFTTATGRFMPARHDAQTYTPPDRAPHAPKTDTRPTTVTAADIRSNYSFRLLLAFTLPRVELVYHLDDGTTSLQLQTADGAWARTPLSDAGTVTYSGTGELWQQVEAAWDWWRAHPNTDHQDFGITRAPDGCMTAVFLPDATRWDLGT